MLITSAFRTMIAAGLLASAGGALAQTAGLPSVGTPGSNRLFGGAAGSPRPVEQTSAFGDSAASVYSTGRPLSQGASARAESGGLSGTIGTSTTGGLFQNTSRVPTGGLFGSAGAAPVGGTDGGASGTGGLSMQSASSMIGNSSTGGLRDSAGTSLTGGR